MECGLLQGLFRDLHLQSDIVRQSAYCGRKPREIIDAGTRQEIPPHAHKKPQPLGNRAELFTPRAYLRRSELRQSSAQGYDSRSGRVNLPRYLVVLES
jgi:hypothetical protein